jgi:hypothetical protein
MNLGIGGSTIFVFFWADNKIGDIMAKIFLKLLSVHTVMSPAK